MNLTAFSFYLDSLGEQKLMCVNDLPIESESTGSLVRECRDLMSSFDVGLLSCYDLVD